MTSTPKSRRSPEEKAKSEEQLRQAAEYYLADSSQSVRLVANKFNVSRTTLQARIAGRPSRRAYAATRQRLSKEEEEAIYVCFKQAIKWGWRVKSSHLRTAAQEVMARRGDQSKLGVNWHIGFFERYPDLKMEFSRTAEAKKAEREAQKAQHALDHPMAGQSAHAFPSNIDPNIEEAERVATILRIIRQRDEDSRTAHPQFSTPTNQRPLPLPLDNGQLIDHDQSLNNGHPLDHSLYA